MVALPHGLPPLRDGDSAVAPTPVPPLLRRLPRSPEGRFHRQPWLARPFEVFASNGVFSADRVAAPIFFPSSKSGDNEYGAAMPFVRSALMSGLFVSG